MLTLSISRNYVVCLRKSTYSTIASFAATFN